MQFAVATQTSQSSIIREIQSSSRHSRPQTLELLVRKGGPIQLVKASALISLPIPWPRRQELDRDLFGTPGPGDLVFAVSHCWRNQMHPDPVGDKVPALIELIEEAQRVHQPEGDTLVFFDFLSIPQRPFREGQSPRTPEEESIFQQAIKGMPRVYTMADATLHLDVEFSCNVAQETEEYFVNAPIERITHPSVQEIGGQIRVMSAEHGLGDGVGAFDLVVSVNGVDVFTQRDLRKAKLLGQRRPSVSSSWLQDSRPAVLKIEKAPFGETTAFSAGEKGWIYLERFCSMIRAALVNEATVDSCVFSNSPDVKRQILDGGRLLREALREGRERLSEMLRQFVLEMSNKIFVALSGDKMYETELSMVFGPSSRPSSSRQSDTKENQHSKDSCSASDTKDDGRLRFPSDSEESNRFRIRAMRGSTRSRTSTGASSRSFQTGHSTISRTGLEDERAQVISIMEMLVREFLEDSMQR